MNHPQTLIAALASAPEIIIGLVREVPPQNLKRRPSTNKWSAHEHACHLTTADAPYLARLELMLSDPSPQITPMFPSPDEEAGALLNVDLDESLALYVRGRARLVERLQQLSEADWLRTAEHPEFSHYSVWIMFRQLLLHGDAARLPNRRATTEENLGVNRTPYKKVNLMKNTTIRMTAIVLVLLAGVVAAQPNDFPKSCPSLPKQKAAPKKDRARSPEQTEADKLIAEAQAAMRSPSRENVTKAISFAEQALKSDVNNVAAYLVLARAHAASQRYLDVQKKVAALRVWENLSKVRALDPANIEGLHLLADLMVARNHDYGCAKKILETALKFDLQNARTNYYYSQILGGMGKFDLAFQYADKAIAVADADSRNFVTVNAGRLRYMAGEYDWVLAHYAKYLASNPNVSLAHFYRSLAFGAKGQFEQALVEAKRAMPDAPRGDAGGIGMLALAYANAGQKEQARELLTELLQRDARGEHVVEYRIAAVYEVLGERDEAFRWLNKDIDDRDGLGSWLIWLNHDPMWKELRKDRRFKDIQQRAGWIK